LIFLKYSWDICYSYRVISKRSSNMNHLELYISVLLDWVVALVLEFSY